MVEIQAVDRQIEAVARRGGAADAELPLDRRFIDLGAEIQTDDIGLERIRAVQRDRGFERRLVALGAGRKLDLARSVLRDASGVELQIVERDVLPGIEVAIQDGRLVQVDAGDVEDDRRALRLFLLRGRFPGLLLVLWLAEIAEVVASVLALDDARLEPGDAHPIDDHLTVKERQQRDGDVGIAQGQELLAAIALAEGHVGHRGAKARIERQFQVSAELERAPGALACQALDLAFVAVGVEGKREYRGRQRHQDYHPAQRKQYVFNGFFHRIGRFKQAA